MICNEVMREVYIRFSEFREEGSNFNYSMTQDRVSKLKYKGFFYDLSSIRAGWFVCIEKSKSGKEIWMVEGTNDGSENNGVNLYSIDYHPQTYYDNAKTKAKFDRMMSKPVTQKPSMPVKRRYKSKNGMIQHLMRQQYRF